MATFHYGGQALIEGVLMRGRNALAVALRHPDGSIVYATERLDLGLRARRALRLPFLRGLVVLYDTLVTGTRWLVRSATLQALALEEQNGKAQGGGPSVGTAALLALHTIVRLPLVAVVGASTDGPGPSADRPGASSYSDPDATSADATPPDERGLGKGYAVAVGGMLLLTLLFAIGIFFLLPLFLAQATVGRVDHGFGLQLSEGLIRIVIFIGYLLLVGRTKDVRRTFEYHGAEHMSIHTLEAGDPLTVDAARHYPTAHPRCGTEFLVVVLIISILLFAVVGSLPPLWLVVSRVVLIPVIAAVSYEILQLGARHRGHALVRWLWSPGIWVQMITTRQPTDDMIEVAIVSLEQAMLANGAEVPAGSSTFPSRPMSPERDLGAAPGTGTRAAGESGTGTEQAGTTSGTMDATRSSKGTPKVNSEGIDP